MLQWTPSERATRSHLSRRFKELKLGLGKLKKDGECGDERKEKAREYVSALSKLVAFNNEAIGRVEDYIREQGSSRLEEQLEYHRILYEGAGSGFRGYTGAHFRHAGRLVRFASLDDGGEFTSSQLRRRKAYLARKLLAPIRIPKGRPQNLIRVTKDGQRLPTCSGQYIRVAGEWFEVLGLPRIRGGHYHCKRLRYDPDDVFSGQMLHDVLAEEIDGVSVRHPLDYLLEQPEQQEALFGSSLGVEFDL